MRRALWSLAVGVGLAAATLSTTWALLFHRPAPTIDGYYRLVGLHERAEVVRDVFGIPRIHARNAHDLFFLQGYVTAQDRFIQMEQMRNAAQSAQAAAFERALAAGSAALRTVLDAYAEGVNKFVDQHSRARALPGELVLHGRSPARWRPADSLVIAAAYVERISARSRCLSVEGPRTLLGRPLVAVDLEGASDMPAPGWQEIGLSDASFRAVGLAVPGVPGLVAGHNGWIAWATLLARGAPAEPAATLEAITAAPLVRDAQALGASLLKLTCTSGRAAVIQVDGPAPLDMRDRIAQMRGLDTESLRTLLGPPPSALGARLFVDLADVDTSRSAVSHGASAHRSSSHYDDQAPLWKVGQTHRLPFTRGAVGRTDGELVFRAR